MEALLIKAAELLFSQGGLLGVVVVALVVDRVLLIRRLDKVAAELLACQQARIDTESRVATALERSTTTGATLIAARDAQARLAEETSRALATLVAQTANGDERLRDSMKDLLDEVRGLVRQCGGRS